MNYPKQPTIENLNLEFAKKEIMEKYGKNLDGDTPFYLGTVVTKDYHFTVFYSDAVKTFIQEKIAVGHRDFLVDGTFDKLPLKYYQLLIIAIEHQNDVS